MGILNKEFGKNMKIDVVIGNPPYQKINGTGIGAGNQSGESIYQFFIVNGCKIADIVCMITPTKWFACNKALNDMRVSIMNSHMTSISILDAKKVFHIIMDKVCFFCWNKKYQGKTQIIDYTYLDNNDTRYINKLGVDCFILNKYDTSIYEKVSIITKEYAEKIIQNNPFGLETNIYGNVIRTSNTELKLHYTGYKFQGDNVGFIEASDVTRGKELFNKYKVIFNRGASTNEIIFTMIICAEPGEICTRSFVVAGPFDNKNDSNNMIKYLKTKMVRTLIRIRKSDQTLYADKFRFVPLQNFTSNSDIDWSQSIADIDKQLYKKYDLSEDEIAYIEKTIKPME